MSENGNRGMWPRRIILAAALTWCAVYFADMMWDFIFNNNGIGFYSKRPYLILLCVAAAVVLGLLVDAIVRILPAGSFSRFIKQNLYIFLLIIASFAGSMLLISISTFLFSKYAADCDAVTAVSNYVRVLIVTSQYLMCAAAALTLYVLIKFFVLCVKYARMSCNARTNRR